MCGIFGTLQVKPRQITPKFAEKLSSLMHHRGPDATGFYGYHTETKKSFLQSSVSEEAAWNVFFLFKRLSILDLNPRSNQPMQSSDGRYTLLFNGEIYNHPTLRRSLEQSGVSFQTKSDTEVLLQYLIHQGTEKLQELEGMFAFAFWDREKNTCTVARDPFGIKPLYFFKNEKTFAFSSQINCLFELPECSRKLDFQQAFNYLLNSDIGFYSRTMLQDIHRLRPGYRAIIQIQPNSISYEEHPYFQWTSPSTSEPLDFHSCVQKTRNLLEESIEKHLVSDVPICFNLSGGVDSSTLVGIASRSHSNLTTFCYQADEPRIDESSYAECVAKHCGVKLVKVKINPTDLEKDFDTYLSKQEELFGSASNYVDYKVFEAQHQAGFTVSLNGQGGDEMFAGYTHFTSNAFQSAVASHQWKRAWSLFKNIDKNQYCSKKRLIALCIDQALMPFPKIRAYLRRKTRTQYSDIGITTDSIQKYLLLYPHAKSLQATLTQALLCSTIPRILRSNDKNAMRFSIENRVPFLWDPLVQFAHRLPETHLISNDGWMKFILRKVLEQVAPKEIAWRKDKLGYVPTEALWLLHNQKFFTSIFESKTFDKIPCIHVKEVRNAWKSICDKNSTVGWKSDIFWRYLCFIRWLELFRIEV